MLGMILLKAARQHHGADATERYEDPLGRDSLWHGILRYGPRVFHNGKTPVSFLVRALFLPFSISSNNSNSNSNNSAG